MVYRRYASLFFIAGCDATDNELITLEIVHRYVEQMDKYYGNVCELDIIFNFQKAYFILDELLLAGEMQESSKKNVLRCIGQQDSLEDIEVSICFIDSSSITYTCCFNVFCYEPCLFNLSFPYQYDIFHIVALRHLCTHSFLSEADSFSLFLYQVGEEITRIM